MARAERETEDADDVAAYDTRKAELAAGGAVLPPEISAAILRGDSRLKAIRSWRAETQTHLSAETGIAQGRLSDLESGRRTGGAETIAKLAQALNAPSDWLSWDSLAQRTERRAMSSAPNGSLLLPERTEPDGPKRSPKVAPKQSPKFTKSSGNN